MRFVAGALVALLAACDATSSTHDAAVTPAVAASSPGGAALEAGLAKIRAHDEGGAIDDLTRAIELDPRCVDAYRWRGHCFNLLGSYAEAIEDYDHAIELDPSYAWSHYARGMANHNLGRHELAIAGYTRSIELDPGFLKAWNWRGFTRKLVGDYAGAAQDLRHALDVAPDDPWALFELAKCEQALGDLDACRSALERARAVNPADASLAAQRGFLEAVRGDQAAALAFLATACEAHAPEETYARIWTWILTADRGAADAALRAWFDSARIDDTWELRLAAFLLGEGTDQLLALRAEEETRRRASEGRPRDFLVCEAAFYAGVRHEFAGATAAAQAAYVRARAEAASEAWEWHLAAVRARALGG